MMIASRVEGYNGFTTQGAGQQATHTWETKQIMSASLQGPQIQFISSYVMCINIVFDMPMGIAIWRVIDVVVRLRNLLTINPV